MKVTGNILGFFAVAVILYVGGYFFVVHQRLRNPFISWPITKPLPMVEYYSVPSLEAVYAPLVQLDQKMFPKRWLCPPTPKEQYALVPNNVDLIQFHQDTLKAQAVKAVPDHAVELAEPK